MLLVLPPAPYAVRFDTDSRFAAVDLSADAALCEAVMEHAGRTTLPLCYITSCCVGLEELTDMYESGELMRKFGGEQVHLAIAGRPNAQSSDAGVQERRSAGVQECRNASAQLGVEHMHHARATRLFAHSPSDPRPPTPVCALISCSPHMSWSGDRGHGQGRQRRRLSADGDVPSATWSPACWSGRCTARERPVSGRKVASGVGIVGSLPSRCARHAPLAPSLAPSLATCASGVLRGRDLAFGERHGLAKGSARSGGGNIGAG